VAEALAHILDRRKAKRVIAGDGEVVLHDTALEDLDKTSD
jgi:hypothetical protein